MEPFVAPKKGLCSIEIGPTGVAVAYSPQNNDITICEFQKYQNQDNNQLDYEEVKECLTKIVNDYGLKKNSCNWVLHPDYYRLALINTPNVPLAEYKKAARWQIKDIINYSLEDAAIDIFYPDETEKTLKKIFVIAAQNSFLQKVVNIIQECGLYPIAVDIREFAIRNLAANLSSIHNETIGLLSTINEGCLIMVVKERNIQFVRRIPINTKNLKNGNCNELTTELQRSFNYCQTELKQGTPTKFFMLPKADFDQNLAQNIAKNLNKEISTFALPEVANFAKPITQQIEPSCWIAVGGALRNMI